MEYLYLLPLLLLITSNIVLLRLRIKASVEYLRNENDDNLSISFYTMKGIFRYKYEVPMVDIGISGLKFRLVKEQGGNGEPIGVRREKMKPTGIFEKYAMIRKYCQENNDFICDLRNYLGKRLIMYQFSLKVEEGTGNASHTGIICGLLWSVSGIITSFLSNNFKNYEKFVSIKPNFNKSVFNVDLKCIFRMRIAHIIVLLAKIYLNGYKEEHLRKNEKKKENRSSFEKGGGGSIGGASNRRINDNSHGEHQGDGGCQHNSR